MLNVSKATNVSGSSVITVDDKSVTVCNLYGSVNYEAKTYNVNTTFNDRTTYKAHKAEVDADIDEFYDYMDALLDD